jgi:hypothetical protein
MSDNIQNTLRTPNESLPPDTTRQQDLTHAGQRRINLIWEYTQAFIAIVVVASTMVVGVKIGLDGKPELTLPTILSTGFGLVVGFYFSRTNHSAIGGIGAKPRQDYMGR